MDDSSEIPICGVDGQHGVWYKANIAFPAEVTISMCDQADFVLQAAIYHGGCGSLVCKASADINDGCEKMICLVDHLEHQYIFIFVNGVEGLTGNFDLTVSGTALVIAPLVSW